MIKDRVTVLTSAVFSLENVNLISKILAGAGNALVVGVELIETG